MEDKKRDDRRLSLIEQNVISIQRDILDLKESYKCISGLTEKINELNIAILTLTEKFDSRYASKKYENNLDKINWIIISAVVLALLGVVIIKN